MTTLELKTGKIWNKIGKNWGLCLKMQNFVKSAQKTSLSIGFGKIKIVQKNNKWTRREKMYREKFFLSFSKLWLICEQGKRQKKWVLTSEKNCATLSATKDSAYKVGV